MTIEDKLQQLRIEWTQHPEKRAWIEKQAAALERAKVWYSKKQASDQALEATVEEAKGIFSLSSNTEEIDSGTHHR